MKKIVRSVLGIAGVMAVMGPVWAQFPESNRTIRLVVPYVAGGSSDYVARLVAKKMSTNMQHNIIVDNKPGGSTVIGGDYVARSKPDGYTIFLIGEYTNASLVALNKKLPYDPVTAFSGITNMVESPLVISVPAEFPAQTLKEFTDYAKANPGQVTYGSAGLGNTLHLAGAQYTAQMGIDMTHVPYKGAAQALVDLIAGRIDVMFDLPQTPLSQIQEGKLRPLAVTSKERLELLPDVPTTAEAGVPEYSFTTRIGLAAPANTPKEITQRLHDEAVKALVDPEIQKALVDRGMYVAVSDSPEAYTEALRQAVEHVTTLLSDAGVEPQ